MPEDYDAPTPWFSYKRQVGFYCLDRLMLERGDFTEKKYINCSKSIVILL